MENLNGKTLFITGASRGIGLAIAKRAARDGANIIIAAKTTEVHPKLPGTIYSAAEEIIEAGGSALPIMCDIRFEEQVESVNMILNEIQASDKPTLMVFNKIDLFSYTEKEEDDLTPRTRGNNSLADWEKTWMSKMNNNCIFISAYEKQNLNEFKTTVYELVKENHTRRYPYNKFLY